MMIKLAYHLSTYLDTAFLFCFQGPVPNGTSAPSSQSQRATVLPHGASRCMTLKGTTFTATVSPHIKSLRNGPLILQCGRVKMGSTSWSTLCSWVHTLTIMALSCLLSFIWSLKWLQRGVGNMRSTGQTMTTWCHAEDERTEADTLTQTRRRHAVTASLTRPTSFTFSRPDSRVCSHSFSCESSESSLQI